MRKRQQSRYRSKQVVPESRAWGLMSERESFAKVRLMKWGIMLLLFSGANSTIVAPQPFSDATLRIGAIGDIDPWTMSIFLKYQKIDSPLRVKMKRQNFEVGNRWSSGRPKELHQTRSKSEWRELANVLHRLLVREDPLKSGAHVMVGGR